MSGNIGLSESQPFTVVHAMERPCEQPSFEISYELTRDDLVEAAFFLSKSSSYVKRQHRTVRLVIYGIALICLLLVASELLLQGAMPNLMLSLVVPLTLVCTVTYVLASPKQQRRQIAKLVDAQKNTIALSPTTIRLSAQGVELENSYVYHRLKWLAVCQVRQSDQYILLYLTQLSAEVIPKSAFDSTEAAEAFFAFAARHCSTEAECPKCHYDLRGNTSGVCPECGTPTRQPEARTAPPTQPPVHA